MKSITNQSGKRHNRSSTQEWLDKETDAKIIEKISKGRSETIK